MAKWRFDDLTGGGSYVFEISPHDVSEPAWNKNITAQPTTAGATLLFEGVDQPQEMEWSGVVLSAAQHNTFVTWFKKRHQVRLTDELGIQTMVYITSYAPKRAWKVSHPYRREYTMHAYVLDVP